jgi:hypothetical protein
VVAARTAHHSKKHFAERCHKSNSRLGKGMEADNTQLDLSVTSLTKGTLGLFNPSLQNKGGVQTILNEEIIYS